MATVQQALKAMFGARASNILSQIVSGMFHTGFGVFKVQPLSSSGRSIADDAHSRIHAGSMFAIDATTPGFSADIANGAALEMLITATGSNYPHIEIAYKLGGAGRVLVYELPDSSGVSGGTELVIKNRKSNSTVTFTGTALRNPTISAESRAAMTFWEGCMIIGTTQGGVRMGSGGSFYDELILTPGKPCLIQVLNESGATVKGCVCVNGYNASTIADT